MWIVTEDDLDSIAVGAGILGTGGGGSPHRGRLLARRHVLAGAQVQIVSVEDVPPDALCVSVCGMGAPVIGIERVVRGDEAYVALRALERRRTPARWRPSARPAAACASSWARWRTCSAGWWPDSPAANCCWRDTAPAADTACASPSRTRT